MYKEYISVIIPVYNKEEYLERCIQSVVNQTYDKLEIILVNDGSSDSSPQMCDAFAQKDKRIKVIHQKNSGAAGARNQGILAATGQYISFIDPDDYISLRFYETLLTILHETSADAVLCKYIRFSGETAKKVTQRTVTKPRVLSTEQTIDGFFGMDGEAFVVPWNKLFKRDLLNGIWFPEGRISEDEFTIYKYLANAKRVAVTEEILYYYYYNTNSETTQQNYNINLDIYDAYDERIRYLKEKRMPQFEGKAQKQYLDRLIQRNELLVHQHDKHAAMLWKLYKKRFRLVKKMVPGIGYSIYNISPRAYYHLVRLKKMIGLSR